MWVQVTATLYCVLLMYTSLDIYNKKNGSGKGSLIVFLIIHL